MKHDGCFSKTNWHMQHRRHWTCHVWSETCNRYLSVIGSEQAAQCLCSVWKHKKICNITLVKIKFIFLNMTDIVIGILRKKNVYMGWKSYPFFFWANRNEEKIDNVICFSFYFLFFIATSTNKVRLMVYVQVLLVIFY